MKNRILIVEDESIVALDIQNRLEAHGFEVIDIVSTGSRAIDRAQTEIPDLILMDINLKGSIDGIETASLINRQIKCPIIFLTAFADEKTLKKARISDASGYILKPFRESELLITIELAIKRASVKKKIEDNRNWLYSTLNNINDAVITVSDENRVIFLNRQADILLQESISPGEIFDSKKFISKIGHKTVFESAGKKIDIEYSLTDILDDDQALLGKVHFIHDISRQVAFEVGLERARLAAEKSNRSKSDFLANVTHELRTPLNTILGMNSIISEMSEDQEISEMHDLIGKAATHLLGQVNEILELADIERGHARIIESRFSVERIISEVLKTFEAQIHLKSLKLIINTGTIPVLTGDKNKIRDIISCLISNAVKFTRKGSITITSSLDSENLVLSFEDTGIGLSQEQKTNLFELLSQADGSHTRIYGGIGVGLSLVNHLLTLLQGTINVESEESGGSRFLVSIPVSISKDQKSDIEEQLPRTYADIEDVDSNGRDYKDLILLLQNINNHMDSDNFEEMERQIKSFRDTHNILELNYESQILFRVAIAVKLKNKNKFISVYNEVIEHSGGVYENSNS